MDAAILFLCTLWAEDIRRRISTNQRSTAPLADAR